MKVIATGPGYDGIVLRDRGDEFDMPDGATGSWFDPVDGEATEPVVKKSKEKAAPIGKPITATTMSAMTDLA
jgi:hypothetical protein